VRDVRPGDLVLRWDKKHGPGVVGYSHVLGEPFASTITWQSRGTYGRQRNALGPEPAWQALLGGYRQLTLRETNERAHIGHWALGARVRPVCRRGLTGLRGSGASVWPALARGGLRCLPGRGRDGVERFETNERGAPSGR